MVVDAFIAITDGANALPGSLITASWRTLTVLPRLV